MPRVPDLSSSNRTDTLSFTHVIDFLPGVQAYDNTLRVDICALGDYARMVVTLEPMHDQAFTNMSAMGFMSQLGKLNARFEGMPAASGPIPPFPAVTPLLMFAGQAEEAMTWYGSLIGNSAILSIERYGEAGSGTAGSVLQARFSLNGREFSCIDSPVKHLIHICALDLFAGRLCLRTGGRSSFRGLVRCWKRYDAVR
jgi:hypothetical protein